MASREVWRRAVVAVEVAAQQGRPHAAALGARNALVDLDRGELLRVAGALAVVALDGRIERREWTRRLRLRVGLEQAS